MVGVTNDLTSRFNAVDLVRKGAEALGGKGGGGRPDMAQAGGPRHEGRRGARRSRGGAWWLMSAPFAVRCFTDESRVAELLAFTHGVFGALVIDRSLSVLKETAADFLQRLRSETCFVVEADGRLIGSVFCVPKGDAVDISRLAVAPDRRCRGSRARWSRPPRRTRAAR